MIWQLCLLTWVVFDMRKPCNMNTSVKPVRDWQISVICPKIVRSFIISSVGSNFSKIGVQFFIFQSNYTKILKVKISQNDFFAKTRPNLLKISCWKFGHTTIYSEEDFFQSFVTCSQKYYYLCVKYWIFLTEKRQNVEKSSIEFRP